MKKYNRVTGNKGEDAATQLLISKGYEVLARNYRNKWGEIDIVAKQADVRVFVEVKTKIGERFGEPWEMINEWKMAQVERVGEMWCNEYGYHGQCRIDVVGVWLNESGEVANMRHWENVVL